jgi:hypothetical protein
MDGYSLLNVSISPLKKSPIRILFPLDPFDLNGYFDFTAFFNKVHKYGIAA